jgi:hypothetical protein
LSFSLSEGNEVDFELQILENVFVCIAHFDSGGWTYTGIQKKKEKDDLGWNGAEYHYTRLNFPKLLINRLRKYIFNSK